MKSFSSQTTVGLREKETHKLVAVYPEPVTGNFNEIEDKVKFWYYQQGCEAGEKVRNYFVDILSENELKNYRASH